MSRQPRQRARVPQPLESKTSRVIPFSPEKTAALESAPIAAGAARAERASDCVDDRPIMSSPDSQGHALERERERLGLSLEELARRTKISKAILHAIEVTDVSHLPAPIYTRGFVKAYAREVGLDPQRTADSYLRNLAPSTAENERAAMPTPAARRAAAVDTAHPARALVDGNAVRRIGGVMTVLAATALVVYVAFSNREEPSRRDESALAPASSALGEEALALEADTADAATAPLRIELTTRGECWVVARVDGERRLMKLLPAGARESLEVGDEMVLRVGEPGALMWSINGQPGRALGPAGQPTTVRMTRENFRDFLSS